MSSHHHNRRKPFLAVLAASLAAVLLLAAPAHAKKTHLFIETFGSAAKPSLQSVNSLALEADGDLLVIDPNAKTISRWNPDGTPADFSALGTNLIDAKGAGDGTPENGFTFTGGAGEQQVAVDNSATGTDGNIYVTQGRQDAGNLIDIFTSSGEYLGQLTAAGTTEFGSTGFPFSPCGVAVDGTGNLFVAAGFERKIYKYDPAGNPPLNGDHVATFSTPEDICNLAIGAGPSAGSLFANTFFTLQGDSVLKLDASAGALQYRIPGEYRLLTVDTASGHLYTVEQKGSARGAAYEFDAAGGSAKLVSTFPGAEGSFTGITGIAIDGLSGKIYLSDNIGDTVEIYGPLVTVPDAVTGKAEITGDTSVRLHGTVNPDGEPLTECFFEYDTAPYSNSPELFAGKEGEAVHGQTVPCVPAAGTIGSGSAPVAVQADVGGLDSETLYHFRLVAKNANAALYPNDANSAGRGASRTFKSPGEPNIKAQWVQDVVTRDATLRATINPENSPTTYRFEWGLTTAYGNSSAEIAIGSGEADATVRLDLGGLEPGATYHWRTVATNGIGVSEGPDHAFTTFLPFEPSTECPNQDRRSGSSGALPDCRAYELVSPIDKGGTDLFCPYNAVELGRTACWTQSTPTGAKLTYTAPRAFGDSPSAKNANQYVATRTASGWSSHGINPPQDTTIFDPDFSVLELKNPFRGFTSDLATAWLVDYNASPLAAAGREGFENVYRRDNGSDTFEALTTLEPLLGSPTYETRFRGFSADGTRAFVDVPRKLTANAASNTKDQIYEISAGKTKLVSVLPNGSADPNFSRVGAGAREEGIQVARETILDTAVSADGSRVFWTSSASGSEEGRIYLRIDGKETVSVSGSVDPGEGFRFWQASPDGARALFSADAGVGGQLYVFEVETQTATEIAPGGVFGVAGVSEDLSHVYFGSTAALAPGAVAGERNLYHAHAGEIDLVAALDPGLDFAYFDNTTHIPIEHVARVTPDGRRLAFMSNRSLTGYDNADAATGEPASEVFLYDAESEELLCASCNPSGARPLSEVPLKPFNNDFKAEQGGVGRWVAAWIPPWPWSLNPLHPLSEDGDRLFFNSFDALLPRDTNGAQDVYQWEAPGSGDCDEGDGNYFEPNGGCLSLISSGQSPEKSEFAEASPDGASVFFTTTTSLDPADPGLIDIYVARAGGGYPLIAPPSPCLGDACQSVPAPPDDPTPASSAFEGAGNVEQPTSCAAAARRARALANRARRQRRAAKRAKSPASARGMRRRAQRSSKRARRLAKRAVRCRADRKRTANANRRAAR